MGYSNQDVDSILNKKPADFKPKSNMIFNDKTGERILFKKNKHTGRAEITSVERLKK